LIGVAPIDDSIGGIRIFGEVFQCKIPLTTLPGLTALDTYFSCSSILSYSGVKPSQSISSATIMVDPNATEPDTAHFGNQEQQGAISQDERYRKINAGFQDSGAAKIVAFGIV
jgi:hypothetical protein